MIKVIVVIKPKIDGCVYYRQWVPHIIVNREKDFEVTVVDGMSMMPDSELEGFHIAHFHKGYMHDKLDWLTRCKKLGIKTVVDFDDYWWLPTSHGLYNDYYFELDELPSGRKVPRLDKDRRPIKRKYNTSNFFFDQLRAADYITCTTPLLADEIRKINRNVEVFENSIDPTEEQWKIHDVPYDKVRLGWIGGSMHWPDIQLLRGTPNKLANSPVTKGKYELRLFGYTRGSVFTNFANIFTDYGKYLDPCKLYPPRKVLQLDGDPSYTQYYNELDVALVPLVGDKFNSLKSELKLVEAGFFRKPVVVSDVWPYKYVISNSNAMIIRHRTDWFKKIRKLIEDKSLREDLGWKLYDTVKDKYDARIVGARRAQWYRSII